MDNFIEHRNFFKIYKYNKVYRPEHRRHRRALNFQIFIFIFCLVIAGINYRLDNNFVADLYLDQFNRIYALLVALLTAILIGLTPLGGEKLKEIKYDYAKITYKQDYTSIIVYTIWLFMVGILTNIIYASFFQYFGIMPIDLCFWIIRLFIMIDSIFFTIYCVDELADLIQKI